MIILGVVIIQPNDTEIEYEKKEKEKVSWGAWNG